MLLKDYKIGNKVEVLMNNPRLNNKNEWRDAEVIDTYIIHPNHGPGYVVLMVKVIRTYCKVVDTVYRWVDNVKVYDHDVLDFFDKENSELVLYSENIKLKTI